MKELPVVCTLGPATFAVRQADLLPALARRAQACEEAPDGLRLRLSADDLPAVMTTIDRERQCCRFLQFDVRVEPDGGAVWLTLSGPPGTREFLLALVGS